MCWWPVGRGIEGGAKSIGHMCWDDLCGALSGWMSGERVTPSPHFGCGWDYIAYVPGSILTTPRQLVAACCLRATTPVLANEAKRPSAFHRRSHRQSVGARQVSAWKEIVAYPPQMATPAVMLRVGRQTALLS